MGLIFIQTDITHRSNDGHLFSGGCWIAFNEISRKAWIEHVLIVVLFGETTTSLFRVEVAFVIGFPTTTAAPL
jgi:hypothetical protein